MHIAGSPTIPPNPHSRRSSLASCGERTSRPPRHHLLPSIYDDDCIAVTSDDTILSLPPSARAPRLTRHHPGPPSPLDDFSSAPASSHQWPLTNALLDRCKFPSMGSRRSSSSSTSTARSPSPTKPPRRSLAPLRSMTTQSSSSDCITKSSPLFGDWFNGVSGPPKEDVNAMDHILTSRPPPRNPSIQSTTGRRFSWFKSAPLPSPRSTAPKSPSPPPSSTDPLIILDMNALLFPAGQPDPSSPSAFQDLLSNAQTALLRLQAAYRSKADALHDLAAECSVHDEEVEEAKTRARHLKLQLDDMAARAVAQDEAMREMAEELKLERERRLEEQESERQRGGRKQEDGWAAIEEGRADETGGGTKAEDPDEGTSFAQQQQLQHHKRESETSFASDSGFESEAGDSSSSIPADGEDSVFSQSTNDSSSVATSVPETPVSSPHPDDVETCSSLPESRQMPRPLLLPSKVRQSSAESTRISSLGSRRVSSMGSKRVVSVESKRPNTSSVVVEEAKRPNISTTTSTYDRVYMKGMLRYPWEAPDDEKRQSCMNCGVAGDQASAWAAVRTFREQNEKLKKRVGELEGAVEGALGLIGEV